MFLVIALALGCLLLLNRAATFRYDDWNIIAHRRSWSLDALFAPLNEHWVTLTVLIFKLGFATVGIHSAFPYVGVLLVLNCAAGFELFLLIQRQSGFGPALSALVIFLLLAQGHENLFWPTQINFAGSAVFGLGAFPPHSRI